MNKQNTITTEIKAKNGEHWVDNIENRNDVYCAVRIKKKSINLKPSTTEQKHTKTNTFYEWIKTNHWWLLWVLLIILATIYVIN